MIPSTNYLKESGIEMDRIGYIPVNELMETDLEGIYAVGDNRVKYLRQVVSAAGDGATAAVAAERYIEEMDTFNTNVLKGDKKILLLFFNALNNVSLEFSTLLEVVNQELLEPYKVVKIDMATKKNIAQKYDVKTEPSVIVLDRGQEIKRLDYSNDKENLKAQLR